MNALDYSAVDYVGTQIHTADTQPPGRIVRHADAVVIGTGPGGLSAARELARGGMKVVMLEAGSFWPRGSFERRQSWALRNLVQDNGPRIMMGNTPVPVVSGRGVGGGTLINSGICFRTPESVLDEWIERHGVGLWEDADRLYAEVETTIGVTVTSPGVAGNNSLVQRRGWQRLGVRHGFMPRNAPGCVGCGTCQTGCPSGGKASADLNWLPDALRHGALVYADTRADEIVMDGSRAVGVRGTMIGKEGEARAAVEIHADHVVLAAGAVNTPMMLLRQGLASSSGLVGRNLRVHPGGAIVAQFDEEIRIWSGATQGYYAHHPSEPEILAEAFSASPETFYTGVGEPGQAAHELLRALKHLGGCGFMIRDSSAGTIRRITDGPPLITYDVNEEDRRKMTVGAEFVSHMFFAAGATRVRPLLAGSTWFYDFSSCRAWIRSLQDPADYLLYASHPMGTCRIGDDPARSVVRARDGRTHDHEGLYVMDASLFPTALGVNPQMTIMAQSLALARQLVQS